MKGPAVHYRRIGTGIFETSKRVPFFLSLFWRLFGSISPKETHPQTQNSKIQDGSYLPGPISRYCNTVEERTIDDEDDPDNEDMGSPFVIPNGS